MVGFFETGVKVAELIHLLGGYVYSAGEVRVVRPGVVQRHGILGHCLLYISVRGQRLVLDLDQ